MKNKGINCPDNHNLKNKNGDSATTKREIKRDTNSLKLQCVMDDFVLPMQSIKTGPVKKANRTMGWERRYLLLGATQLIIARDKNFERIVNVIPLEGGFCMI